MRLASGTWRLQAAGGLSPPALPSSPAAARLAPAMPCVADWLNNPFSIVQGIFGERGPGGAGILSAATRPPGGRRDGGFPSRGGGGTRPGRPGRSGKSSEGGRPLPPSPVGAGKETRCRGLRGGVRPSPAAGGPVPEPCPGSEVYLGLAGWLGGKKSENNTYWGVQEERVLAACVTDQ